MRVRHTLMIAALAAAGLMATEAGALGETCADDLGEHNDYPTETRADYVYGCMLVNGEKRDVLERCSCSIDVISSILPYKDYEEAETILSVRQRGGESVSYMFNAASQEKVKNLKRAQIEGELRCF